MYQPVNFRAVLLAAALTASPAAAEPFTYQGQIQDAGAPANGVYDFRFQLFDAPSGGSQIGPTLTFDDIVVTDGLFQVDPDFGDVFNQDDAFIFIQVREGTSTGGYTGLLPRTPVNATPKAQHATTADTVLNPQWTEAPGILTYGTGTDRVLINRTNAIASGEFFGVHGETTGFAGMYVSGPAGSLPFYAYSIDGGINAYTYVDAASNWNLNINNSFIALSVDSDGNTFIAGDTQAESFSYTTPKTNYVSVMGDSFHSASDDPFIASTGNGGANLTNTGTGWLVAPIQLPHGATVTKVRFYFNDTFAGADLSITLARRGHGSPGFFFMTDFNTSGFNGNYLMGEDTTISSPVIDNNLYSYQLRAWAPDWPGNNTLAVQSVVVEYTTTQAD